MSAQREAARTSAAHASTEVPPTPGLAVIRRADPDHPTHRERLLEAMADAIREHGFRSTTVAEVVRRARTSRRTFYEHFEDRGQCFLELFDAMNIVLSERIAAALDPQATWAEQVERAVGVYIDEVSRERALALACTREMAGLGDAGAARQRKELEQFADLLVALVAVVDEQSGVLSIRKPVAIMITGGLRELVAYGLENDATPDDLKATAAGVIKSVLDPAHRDWSGTSRP